MLIDLGARIVPDWYADYLLYALFEGIAECRENTKAQRQFARNRMLELGDEWLQKWVRAGEEQPK